MSSPGLTALKSKLADARMHQRSLLVCPQESCRVLGSPRLDDGLGAHLSLTLTGLRGKQVKADRCDIHDVRAMQLLSVERLFEDDSRHREAEEIRILILEAKVSACVPLSALRIVLNRFEPPVIGSKECVGLRQQLRRADALRGVAYMSTTVGVRLKSSTARQLARRLRSCLPRQSSAGDVLCRKLNDEDSTRQQPVCCGLEGLNDGI